jgi:hypothetical protein
LGKHLILNNFAGIVLRCNEVVVSDCERRKTLHAIVGVHASLWNKSFVHDGLVDDTYAKYS